MKLRGEKGQGLVEVLIIIALIVGALIWSGVIDISPANQADPTPAPNSAEQAAINIQNLTPTPGAGSNGQLPTAIPWTTNIEFGEEAQLREALHGVYGSSGFDYRVTTINTRGGVGIYCIVGFTNPLLGPGYDPNIPIPDQINSGRIKVIAGGRYCAAWFVLGELWAGVPQSALQKLDSFQSEARLELTPTTVDPSGITRSASAPNGDRCPDGTVWISDDSTTNQHTCGQWVDVTLHVPFGLLTSSTQPTNQVKFSIDHPHNVIRSWGDFNAWVNGTTDYQTYIDQADTYAYWLARYDLIAPIDPNGGRDLSNLNRLKADMDLHYNSPSPNPQQPWPYDHLRQLAQEKAVAAGYQGVRSFRVVLEWPGRENEWVYLESIEGGNYDYVVDPTDLQFNQNNVYQLYAAEFKAAGTTPEWVPSWARSWFRWP